MKIALLTNAFGPPGGAGRIAEMQVGILKDAGHEVRVFRPDTGWLRWPAPIRLLRHLADLFSHREMTDKIIAWHPDVLLTHNLTGCGFGTPSAVSQKSKVKSQKFVIPTEAEGSLRNVAWIHVLHDVQLFEPSGRLKDAGPVTRWQKTWTAMRQFFFGTPDLVISPTKWLLDQHLRRGWFEGVRTEVLPNPAPPVSFALRAPSDPLRLLSVGGTKEKGAELMSDLEMRYALSVTILETVSHAQVLNAMREADVLLVPSQIEENQPTVILEAMSVGLPVIASDVGGVRETLGDAGLIVPRDSEEAWIRAIESLQDPETYRDQSTAMYERAKAFDAEKYATRFLSFIGS